MSTRDHTSLILPPASRDIAKSYKLHPFAGGSYCAVCDDRVRLRPAGDAVRSAALADGQRGVCDRYRRSGPSTRLRAASSSRRVVKPSNRARTMPPPSTTKIHGSERRFHSSTVGENLWRDPASQISWCTKTTRSL